MENSFDLLEEKVRKAAELVRKLRKDNLGLEEQVAEGKRRMQDAEKRLHDAEKKLHASEKEHGASVDLSKELDVLNREVKALRHEREEVRTRIAKLVEVLETLDA